MSPRHRAAPDGREWADGRAGRVLRTNSIIRDLNFHAKTAAAAVEVRAGLGRNSPVFLGGGPEVVPPERAAARSADELGKG